MYDLEVGTTTKIVTTFLFYVENEHCTFRTLEVLCGQLLGCAI